MLAWMPPGHRSAHGLRGLGVNSGPRPHCSTRGTFPGNKAKKRAKDLRLRGGRAAPCARPLVQADRHEAAALAPGKDTAGTASLQ